MSSNRKITLTVRILLVLAVLLVGLGAGLYFFLPHYLESRVVPQLLAKIGISNFAVSVRHLGIYVAEWGVLRIQRWKICLGQRRSQSNSNQAAVQPDVHPEIRA